MRAWFLLICLVFLSGCFSLGNYARQDDCESVIADLPKIIEENQGRVFSVTGISDGDTIEIEGGQKVRFIGLNTPEKGLKWSGEATQLTSELTANGISISRDAEPEDQYNRMLRYVFTEDKFVNAELVRQGLATTFPVEPNTLYAKLFECLEEEAKENKRGLWSSSVNYDVDLEVGYDAEGPDNENLNGEFVVVTNSGTEDIDMNGWYIKDQATHFYYFKNIVLSPGESIILYTGSGSDTGTEVYWNSKDPIWNNAGDTAYLFDNKGDLVISLSFP